MHGDMAALNEVIGAIYETALDPSAWVPALEAICSVAGGMAAWVAIHYPDTIRSVYQIEVGTDPEWQRRLREQYVAISPLCGATHHLDAGDVVSVGDVIDYDEFIAGRFYREWAAPQGWPDIIMAITAKEQGRFSWLGVCLPDQATQAQKQVVTALLPHMERALRISDLLQMRAAEAADLAAAVEELTSGMVLLDGSFGVRGINPAGHRMIADAVGLSLESGRLRISGTAPGDALAQAIADCADGRMQRGGASILFDRTELEAGIMAHVLPLPVARAPNPQRAVAALFLTDPAQPSRQPLDGFVRRFSLTPSETRVLLAMLEGKTPAAIAAMQGVALPTVRTHLSRLYDKTATSGQTQLVRLVTSLTHAV